jgi:hypothetical protein
MYKSNKVRLLATVLSEEGKIGKLPEDMTSGWWRERTRGYSLIESIDK